MIRRYGDMKLYIMPLDSSTGLYSTLWLTCLLLLYQVQFQNMMVASASIFQVEPVLYAWLGENTFFSPAQIWDLSFLNHLALVVQKVDNAIQRISISKTNWVIQWIVIYPVDSAIHPSNNWGQ